MEKHEGHQTSLKARMRDEVLSEWELGAHGPGLCLALGTSPRQFLNNAGDERVLISSCPAPEMLHKVPSLGLADHSHPRTECDGGLLHDMPHHLQQREG